WTAGALRVVVDRVRKPVDAGRQRVVELEQGPRLPHPVLVRGAGEPLELLQRLALEAPEEARAIDPAPEPGAVEGVRTERQIEGTAARRGPLDLARERGALLAQPLHQHVSAQREAGQGDAVGLRAGPADELVQVPRLAGMVRADQAVHVARAAA